MFYDICKSAVFEIRQVSVLFMVSVRNLHFSEIEGVGTKSKAESSKKTIELKHSSGASFKESLKQFTKGKISYIPENIKPWEFTGIAGGFPTIS